MYALVIKTRRAVIFTAGAPPAVFLPVYIHAEINLAEQFKGYALRPAYLHESPVVPVRADAFLSRGAGA